KGQRGSRAGAGAIRTQTTAQARFVVGSCDLEGGIQTPPQIPARNRRIRLPRLADLDYGFVVRQLALSIMLLDRRSYTVIERRQNVGPAQGEHEKHLGRPGADSFDSGQVLDDLLV